MKNFLNEKVIKITKQTHAFKRYTSSYNVEILNSFTPELELNNTESSIKNKLINLLTELKGFKFVTTLVLKFRKIQGDDKTLYNTFYLNSSAETVINDSDIDGVFE